MIPQIQPWIDETELNELKRVISSTFVTENELTKEFEQRTRELTKSKHAITMFNGTVALYCALKALKIGPGDEVIVPDMTFIATANAVIMAGAVPVFCDVNENTFGIDADKAAELITPKTKALMPVHLYGQSADMDAVMKLSGEKNLYVVEDAAQGVGVKFNGRHTGTFGNAGILSYYGNKTITCGEGGMVLTEDDELALTCYRLKNHGRDKKGIFYHDHIGFNFSFTEMQAAVGIAQMKKFERIKAKKKKIYDTYISQLNNLERFRPVFIDPRCEPVFWFTSFMTDDVEPIAEFLHSQGIQTRRFFYPLHLQPCYKGVINTKIKPVISEKIYNQGLSLPSSYQLTEEEQDYVISKIREFYNK